MSQIIERALRMSVYSIILITLTIIGFTLAVRGMETLIGTNYVQLDSAVGIPGNLEKKPVILGKVGQQAGRSMGQQMSRKLDDSHHRVTDSIDSASIQIGKGIQEFTRRLMRTFAQEGLSSGR
jgi:hypothetical protein